jgi:polysaccharide export outer membrane protein
MLYEAEIGRRNTRSGTIKRPDEQVPQDELIQTVWDLVQRPIAAILLLIALPMLVALFFVVRLTSRGPFIYAQARPGRFGRMFKTYKIRSMVQGADRDPKNARSVRSSDPVVTSAGRILRELKLDELPQLWNVVRGQMALVGPRPIAAELQNELEREIPGFQRRLTVKPGVTSLAQVCVIESKSQEGVLDDWRSRWAAEEHYLDNRSVTYDLVVIGLTILYFGRKIAGRVTPSRRAVLAISVASIIGLFLSGCASTLDLVGFKSDGDILRKNIAAQRSDSNPAFLDIRNLTLPTDVQVAPEPGYRVGPGDQLEIDVFGEPGLTKLTIRVDADGYIQMPALELVSVRGMTTRQIQSKLKAAYSQTFINPWVVVRISKYRSRPIYLLGEFNTSGVVYLDGPTNLVQAIAHGNGLSDGAYLRGGRVLRDGNVMPVDLYGLLRQGRMRQNVWLNPGDTVFIPHRRDQKAYVLGAVAKPGPITLGNEGVTLLEALGTTEGPLRAEAKLDQVRIIRATSPVEGQLILIDVDKILSGKASDFPLQAGDIVYVPLNSIANWNDAIKTITPAVQLMGGVLQPFVQVKFLRED